MVAHTLIMLNLVQAEMLAPGNLINCQRTLRRLVRFLAGGFWTPLIWFGGRLSDSDPSHADGAFFADQVLLQCKVLGLSDPVPVRNPVRVERRKPACARGP